MRSLLAIVLFASLLLAAVPAAAQELPVSRYVTCGNLELHLVEHGVNTLGRCESGTLYVLGNCGPYQTFDFSVTVKVPTTLSYEWYCGEQQPGYVTKTTCWEFPGMLHLRLIAKDNSTLEEVHCPS